LEIIEEQLKILLKRGRYIKNSLFFILLSALLVVLFSFTALISYAIGNEIGQYAAFVLFGISLLAVFVGVLYAILEIHISYKAVLIDIDALQENKKEEK
jgi:predicted membrane protein